MGLLILTIAVLMMCVAIRIYSLRKELESSRNAYRFLLKENEKLKEDKEFWKKQEQKKSDYYYEELEKKHKLVDSIKEYKKTIWDLEEKNRDLKHKVWESDNAAREAEFKVMDLERETMNLERKVKTLESTNDQLMDKIINHLKTKEIITSNKTTTTEAETLKIKAEALKAKIEALKVKKTNMEILEEIRKERANKITKLANSSVNWQTINKHGFSVNKMYESNPNYDPRLNNNKLTKTHEYKVWQKDILRLMRISNIKSLKDLNVDPNKPMKIEIEFKLVKNSDTDNPVKAFVDTLVKYYGLTDDNNFYVINASRDLDCARGQEMGQGGRIRFKITNI